MHRLQLAPFVLVMLAGCARSEPSLDVFFKNTVMVRQPWGEKDPLLLSANGSYVMYGIRFPEGRGRWRKENGLMCLTPGDTPETKGKNFCNDWDGRKVGDKWTIDVGGETVEMEIVEGRITSPAPGPTPGPTSD